MVKKKKEKEVNLVRAARQGAKWGNKIWDKEYKKAKERQQEEEAEE